MSTDTTQHGKPRFIDICQMFYLDAGDLQDIARKAMVDNAVVHAMYLGNPVRRHDAEKVLTAMDERTGKTWTLDTVKVVLFPTFQTIQATHNFNLAALSTHSGVPFAMIDMMLIGQPVPVREAHLVLQIASRLSGHQYTLENVDMKLEDGESDGR